MYNTNSRIKFKTSMLKSSLCDYSHAYIPVKGTMSVTALQAGVRDNGNKNVISKNSALHQQNKQYSNT